MAPACPEPPSAEGNNTGGGKLAEEAGFLVAVLSSLSFSSFFAGFSNSPSAEVPHHLAHSAGIIIEERASGETGMVVAFTSCLVMYEWKERFFFMADDLVSHST